MPRTTMLQGCAALLLAAAGLAGCDRGAGPAAATAQPVGPAASVERLAADLRRNDAAGFARHALPPGLHARVAAGWRDGRSRWPLDELPLDAQLPTLLASLAAPGSEQHLVASFDRQFARSGRELQQAAHSLGLFGVEYLGQDASYSEEAREHYRQGLTALAQWGGAAPLADRTRARATVVQLASAARRTGIATADDFSRLGMEDSLRRLGPFLAALKAAFARYGLDLDASFDSIEASLLEQTGDSARVRLRYALGGQPIDAVLVLRRVDGQWYLRDHLAHAEASLAAGTADDAPPASAGWWPWRSAPRLARRAGH